MTKSFDILQWSHGQFISSETGSIFGWRRIQNIFFKLRRKIEQPFLTEIKNKLNSFKSQKTMFYKNCTLWAPHPSMEMPTNLNFFLDVLSFIFWKIDGSESIFFGLWSGRCSNIRKGLSLQEKTRRPRCCSLASRRITFSHNSSQTARLKCTICQLNLVNRTNIVLFCPRLCACVVCMFLCLCRCCKASIGRWLCTWRQRFINIYIYFYHLCYSFLAAPRLLELAQWLSLSAGWRPACHDFPSTDCNLFTFLCSQANLKVKLGVKTT